MKLDFINLWREESFKGDTKSITFLEFGKVHNRIYLVFLNFSIVLEIKDD